ncbi:MAG: hypothetical protein US71_C0012G0024 [Parcubacteria group bacterium GW2011_GWD2_38_12]|nr:MAG: hypothetical protein US06_C0009G0003 [Parcubacteria group bacterium GW2011_GWC2_36_17]KKQ51408.1 MAG: hypothetical protein US71_C0012G0024 [Parcubacteria group bacterium GW2011_GWD2_38_12]KKQ58089.1 MAG: hypothetical protein US78_C0024G0004 [Parcubacteria group bacterium GW2011_GWD1_38_16]
MKYDIFAPLDRRNLYLTGLSVILILLLWLTFVQPVFALTISPVRMEISGDPGQTLQGELELLNEQKESKTFYSSAQNFEARGESGAPYFLPDTSKGLASWIKVQESVTLKPDERKTIPFSIEIPRNTEPAGYFAAILWGTSPPQTQGGGEVTIGGKLGVLILLSVSGETQEGGGLLEFKTEGGKFLTSLPITFNYRFSNDGSQRARPEGRLKVKNIFGGTSAMLSANSSLGNILPKSIRKFEVVWKTKSQDDFDEFAKVKQQYIKNTEEEKVEGFFGAVRNEWKNFAFGLYKAELDLTYGQEQKTAEAQFRFFVFPWHLLSIIIFIFALLGIGGWFGLKKYNRWIIKKAQSGKFQ